MSLDGKSHVLYWLPFVVGKLYAVGGLVCGIGVHSGAPFRYCDNGSECFDPETGH